MFCESCRENMLLHPVEPGTAIHLPNRTARKKAAPKKRPIPPEEQIQNLRRSLRRARGFALILLVILIMTAVIFVHQLTGAEAPVQYSAGSYRHPHKCCRKAPAGCQCQN